MNSGFPALKALCRVAAFALLTSMPVAAFSQSQTDTDIQSAQPRQAAEPGPAFEPADPANAGLTVVPQKTTPYTDEEFARLPDAEKVQIYNDAPNLLPADFSPGKYEDLLHPERRAAE